MTESVIVDLATQHIESKMEEGSGMVKVKVKAKDLLLQLRRVNEIYVGAEGRTDNYQIQGQVRHLRMIAYDAEDVVDDLVLVSKARTSSFFHLHLETHRALKSLGMLTMRAKVVKNKLEEYALRSTKELMSRPRGSQSPKDHRPPDGDPVIGIGEETKRIVDRLTGHSKSNDGQQPVTRLAIVGMGGTGKTTLARSIFNHKAVKKHFHYQVWVSVSRGWDTTAVLDDILKQIQDQIWFFAWFDENKGQRENDDESLVTRLNNLLYKKTCLLVLDDVWDLQSLKEFIALITEESYDPRTYRIVITSRKIPLNAMKWCIHHKKCLNKEDSLTLFSLVASNTAKALSVDYHALAMEMLRKCQGLPLAIVALARLLKTKSTMPEWQRVVSQITGRDSISMYGPVNEIMGLSYDEVPHYLKPCFLYLGLFPEGFTIPAGILIRMWIAEGFIKCDKSDPLSNDNDTLEVVGRRYLQELIDYTMVEVVDKTYSGKVKSIQIHVLMRDFCVLRANDLDFLTDSASDPELVGKTSRRAAINLRDATRARQVSWGLLRSNSLILPANSPRLRSLLLFRQSSTSVEPDTFNNQANLEYLNLDQVCQNYKLLRVLEISGIKTPSGTLPRDIGNLIHLTYLRIRSTNIRLPKAIGKLTNLLTLDYRDVFVDGEITIPNVLCKLEKLRHLYLPNEMSGEVDDLQLDTLKDLITLWGVGGGNWMVKEMGKLSSALSKLYVHQISTQDQLTAVLGCHSIKGKGSLYALALNWYGFEKATLDTLSLNQSLQKLRLIGKAPGCQFPANLGKLELWHTQLENSKTMKQIGGLSFLKVLKLSKDSFVGSEWTCRKEEFRVLEELKLANLPKLHTWDMEKETMQNLRKLSIVSCITLKRVPEGLRLIKSLEKLEIERMPYSFISRLQKGNDGKGEDFDIIKHIPEFTVRDSCSQTFD